MNARRIGGVLGLLAMVAGVYLLNRWCVPFSDDLVYCLEGENTPVEGVVDHVSCLADVVRIQVNDYVKGPNGRIFLHSVVTAFCAFGGQGLFDVLNTGMWFALVLLILREGGVKGHFLSGAALVFAFLWEAETCSRDVAFSVNYLWSAVLAILYLRAWRRNDAWWMVPVSFFFGWWQEAFALPMVAALGACCLVRSGQVRRFAWSRRRLFSYLALVLGTLGCIGGHFLSGRTVEAASNSCLSLLALAFWPAVLPCCLMALVIRNLRQLLSWVEKDLEWWLFFVAGACMFLLIGRQGLRLAMPMLLAALVLCLKHRERLPVLRRAVPAVVAYSLVWLVLGSVVQYRQACGYEEMLTTYLRDPQGLTLRRPVATGPLDGTVSVMDQDAYWRGMLRHVCRRDVQPIVLSPSLYAEVMRGAETNRTYQLPDTQRVRWRRYLPGRLSRMFPDESWHQGLPADKVEVMDPAGHRVTIFAGKGTL